MAPRLVYDGDCGFCRYTVDYARAVTGDAVDYVPYQSVVDQYPEYSAEDFAKSIRLFATGSPAAGADAAFRTLALGGRGKWLWLYRRLPGFATVAERTYAWVARHREACLRVARLLFGRELKPARFDFTADIVYRGTMAMALLAFGSLWLQADALIGDNGVLPATDFLDAVHATFGANSYWKVPSVLWLGIPLHAPFAFGVLCALVGLFGKFRTSAALGAYAAYLSILSVGQTFTAFQWDTFLVECLFAAAILARSPVAGIWVLRLLALRFMFLSGGREAALGRPGVGRSIGPRVPLRNATAADRACLVRTPVTRAGAVICCRRNVCDRASSASLDLQPAQASRRGCFRLRVSRVGDSHHRQLQLLQPVDDRGLLGAVGPMGSSTPTRNRSHGRSGSARVGWRVQ